MNQTMSDDIPQDQVEGICAEQWEALTKDGRRCPDHCQGMCLITQKDLARAMRLAAAVERERCAALVETSAWRCVNGSDPKTVKRAIAESIRSVKGAVT